MRKYQLKKVVNLLKVIEQAQTAKMYDDCQKGALFLCDFIEKVEGKNGAGAETVALLIQYCEHLFKAKSGETEEAVLSHHLAKIEDSVNHNISPRAEIVFLSYKSSMSDSIIPVYLAAKADPACDAYFIPIPYFSRNPNGSIGQMHYEGAEHYSDDIEITDWQSYNIEARRPDAVFTFVAYDGMNKITYVHPDFFTERLRNLTDMLVYIPYFVTADNIEKHHMVPACAYAHKTIVQSEKVKESYIRYYKNVYSPSVGNSYGRPEDKFVALGSPKFDIAVNSTRDDFHLPDEWRNLIGDKKVVFYNSSVVPMLEGNEQYFNKLRHIFKVFRNRDDVVLWWRPHPLSEETYRSMRPHLLDEYKQIVNQYRDEGWGILDICDTARDLYRAVVWSDIYYGDPSSVACMFQSIGKPVIMSDYNIISTDYVDDVLKQKCRELYQSQCNKAKTSLDYIFWESNFDHLNVSLDVMLNPTKEIFDCLKKQAETIANITANVGVAGEAIYNTCKEWVLGS